MSLSSPTPLPPLGALRRLKVRPDNPLNFEVLIDGMKWLKLKPLGKLHHWWDGRVEQNIDTLSQAVVQFLISSYFFNPFITSSIRSAVTYINSKDLRPIKVKESTAVILLLLRNLLKNKATL